MSKYYVGGIMFDSENAISHHNVKGSHWGVRRYQNEDGSLTPLGRIHYGVGKAVDFIRKDFANSKTGHIINQTKKLYGVAKDYYTGEKHARNAANMLAAKRGAMRTTREISRLYENMTPAEREAAKRRYDAAVLEYVENNNSAAIEREEEAYRNAPRQKIQNAVNKGKDAVRTMNENRKSLTTKLSDMAEDVIRKAKRLLSRLFG